MADNDTETMYIHNERTGNTVGFTVQKDRKTKAGKTVVDPTKSALTKRLDRNALAKGKASDVAKPRDRTKS